MRIFNKNDFKFYCLIWAAEQDFDTTANDLIAIASASRVGTTQFMSIYSEFEMMTETARKAALLFNANQLLAEAEQCDSFFDDITADFFSNNQYAGTRQRLFAILKKAFE